MQAVDPAEGEVTVAHEAMPGFMEAMTMPFQIKNKAALTEIQPGDIVTGPMIVNFKQGNIKDYQLVDLTPTGLVAPPQAEPGSGKPMFGGDRPAILQVGAIVPDFGMTTQTGSSLRLTDLRGKVVVVTFIYTRCPLPDFCPAVDAKFADVARLVRLVPDRADHVALLSVSFDAEHDTPDVLLRHARLRGAKPPWSYAVANTAELAQVGPLLGLDYAPDREQFSHNLITAVIDPAGRLAHLELGRKWTPAELVHRIIDLIPHANRP